MALDSPDYAGAAQSALSGLTQQVPAAGSPGGAPVATPPPAGMPDTIFGRLIGGALTGLAGGLRQGAENVAGAGTPGYTPNGNGIAYAQQLQAKQDADKRQAQQDSARQSQQDFENKSRTFQDQQQQQLAAAQAVQTKLNGIHQVQSIFHAQQDDQDKFHADQQARIDHALNNGGTELAHIKVSPDQTAQEAGAAYIQAHPEQFHDPNTHVMYTTDANGETEIHVIKHDANARLPASEINRSLAATGTTYRVPDGSTMSYGDAQNLISQYGAKQADQNVSAAVEKRKADLQLRNEQTLEAQRQSGAVSLERMKESAAGAGGLSGDPGSPLPAALETNLAGLAKGDLTPAQATGGVGKDAAIRKQLMTARYEYKYRNPASPDYDPNAMPFEQLESAHRYVASDKFGQSVQAAGELFGVKKPDGTSTPGAIRDIKTKLERINRKWPALSGVDAKVAAHIMTLAGDPDMEDVLATAPDIALKMGKFASGGGPGSESTFNAMRDGLIKPKTLKALNTTMAGVDDLGGETVESMMASGGQYAANRMARINNPGTTNDSQNHSGAAPIYRSSKSTGRRQVSTDGGKTFTEVPK